MNTEERCHACCHLSVPRKKRKERPELCSDLKPELPFHIVPSTWRETSTAALNNLSSLVLPFWPYQARTPQRKKCTGLTVFPRASAIPTAARKLSVSMEKEPLMVYFKQQKAKLSHPENLDNKEFL